MGDREITLQHIFKSLTSLRTNCASASTRSTERPDKLTWFGRGTGLVRYALKIEISTYVSGYITCH